MKKISWIVALLVTLSFTILFSSCGVDPKEESSPVAVTITTGLAVDSLGITLTDAGDGFWTIQNGDSGGQYEGAYLQIPVTLPAGKKLEDVTTVACTIKFISGDVGYKRPNLWAQTAKFVGAQNGKAPIINQQSAQLNGAGTYDVKFAIDDAKVTAANNSNQLWFVIHVNSNDQNKYAVSKTIKVSFYL